MNERIRLDALTTYSAAIETCKVIVQDGIEYPIGLPHRCAYANSLTGRELLTAQVPEPYLSAVLAVWGDTPTVADPPAEGGENK